MVERLTCIWNAISLAICRWLFSIISLPTLLSMAFSDLHLGSFYGEKLQAVYFANQPVVYFTNWRSTVLTFTYIFIDTFYQKQRLRFT